MRSGVSRSVGLVAMFERPADFRFVSFGIRTRSRGDFREVFRLVGLDDFEGIDLVSVDPVSGVGGSIGPM